MRRRTVLASTGLATAGLYSGCLERSGDPPARLGWVGVDNYSPDRHRFRVEVLRGETTVQESTHEIAGRSDDTVHGAVLECTWGDERGPYTVRARVDGGEPSARSIEDAVADDSTMEAPDCVVATVQYELGNSESFTFRIRDSCEAVPTFDGGCAFANADS